MGEGVPSTKGSEDVSLEGRLSKDWKELNQSAK